MTTLYPTPNDEARALLASALRRADDETVAIWRADAEYVYALADVNSPDAPERAANTRAVAAAWLADITAEQDKRRRARYQRFPVPTRGGIPRDVIDDILGRVDLVALVERYLDVDLRRTGSTYVGRCPFHLDRTPSFYVFPDTPAHFHCYGCGVHGDAITVVDHQAGGCGFLAAVDALAAIAGITPPSERPTRPVRRLVPKAAHSA